MKTDLISVTKIVKDKTMKIDEEEETINLEKLQCGELQEFEKIYHKYCDKIYAYAFRALSNRDDAEEITQEVFSTIWQQRKTIYSEGIIWRLIRCRCIDFLRKKKIATIHNEHLEMICINSNINTNFMQEEQKQEWFNKISEGERKVLNLLIRGFTRQEIADVLNLPIGTIDSRLFRLKNKLKGT